MIALGLSIDPKAIDPKAIDPEAIDPKDRRG